MRRLLGLACCLIALGHILPAQPQDPVPPSLLSWEILREIINEASGDMALQNEILLTGVNRNRPPEEYAKGYFETQFILAKLKEYGIKDASIFGLPTRSKTTWDAEMAELWLVEPEKRKIVDLDDVPACLCSGSSTTDTTAELVYVGPGLTELHYRGKNVRGKIVLVNGYPSRAGRLAIDKYGAKGIVAYSSSHPEFDPDEVGWGSIDSEEGAKPAFAFMVSTRIGQDFRDALERGNRIVVRAVVKTRQIAYKEEMAVGLLKGKDYPEEELVFTAHLFEGFAKQGANDDASGCVAILETARVLKKLQDEGKIPPLRRSVRFLFIPEISGTSAYIQKNPEIAKRFFANINEDMVGEALIKNTTAFRLTLTPYSLPSYLNDVTASFVDWLGSTQRISLESGWKSMPVLSPTGTRDPFYYTIDPYSGGSDHVVFVDGGVRVPAVMFIVWPDQWYHSSGDTPDKSDSTQLKRTVFLSAASAVFLASAGPQEIERMMTEVSSRLMVRIGKEKVKAERLLYGADAGGIHSASKEARNVVRQAALRERESLGSIRFFIKDDAGLEGLLSARLKKLDDIGSLCIKEIDDVYNLRCARLKVKPVKVEPTRDEVRLARVVPMRTKKMGGVMEFWEMRDKIRRIRYNPPAAISSASFELRNFIDGKRSILDIRDAASAEFEPLPLLDVEGYMKFLEKLGWVELKKS